MLRNCFLAVLACLSAALAQETGANNDTTPTTTVGEITIHTVTVGRLENEFQPNSIIATPGDIVQFVFYPTNHSVIRAEYGYPCVPYEDITGNTGFYSGFEPIASTNESLPTWNLTINNTDPVFYYCGAPGSCIGWGMLGVINPNASTSLDTQLLLAKQANYMLEPGQKLPSDAMTSLQSLAATATTTLTVTASATGSPSTTPAVPAPSDTEDQHHHSGLSGGATAGIAVGAVAVAILAALLFFLLGRTKTLKEMLHHNNNTASGQPGMRDAGAANTSFTAGHGQSYSRHHSSQLPPYQTYAEHKPPVTYVSPELAQDERFQSGAFAPPSDYRFSGTSELGSDAAPPSRSMQPSPVAYELFAGRSPTGPEPHPQNG